MKNIRKLAGIIAIAAVIGMSVIGCGNGSTGNGDFTVTIKGIPNTITSIEITVGGLQGRPVTVSDGVASASIESYKLEPPFKVEFYDKTNDETYRGKTSYTTKESITVPFTDFVKQGI